jgi:predicted dehydrogenase
MRSLLDAELVEVAGVVDPMLPGSLRSLDALLSARPDGVVIATPSALHAEQAIRALGAGVPVFCQKPLGRDAGETEAVVEAARSADCLLGVDLCYRTSQAARRCRQAVAELGQVYAAELTFHNVYGPDASWFYDPELSGGGCVIDLGIHLVDLALWVLEGRRVASVDARLVHHGGYPVEDYAVARLELETGTTISIACSWNLPAGRAAVIEAAFYGSRGGVRLHNVEGSFHHLRAERCDGVRAVPLAEPPDAWGGRATCEWAAQLACDKGYDPQIEHVVETARVLDRIYGREQ